MSTGHLTTGIHTLRVVVCPVPAGRILSHLQRLHLTRLFVMCHSKANCHIVDSIMAPLFQIRQSFCDHCCVPIYHMTSDCSLFLHQFIYHHCLPTWLLDTPIHVLTVLTVRVHIKQSWECLVSPLCPDLSVPSGV